MKKSSGITLIALVVTIVVLLILASVSIGMLTGNNGIIKQATEAQIMTELANVKEALDIYKTSDFDKGVKTDEDLIEEGLLKEVFINDTYRTIAVLTNLKAIEVSGKLGKTGEKQDQTEVDTLLDLYDVYGVDIEDGTLYYIKNGIWSIEGNKTTYTADTGEEKEGYVIETTNQRYLEDMKLITEWTVDAGTTITLPICQPTYNLEQSINVTIEWGADDNDDGELDIEQCTTVEPTHTYTEAGTYTIKILGTIPAWTFSKVSTSKDYITGLKQWGKLNAIEINFLGCTNLTGTIPNHKIKGEFELLSEAGSLFANCTNISGNIPSDLFSECENIWSVRSAFANCENLTGAIPANLFEDCINIRTFYDTFRKCFGLTGEIPANLFENNTKAEDFRGTFWDCSGLTGTIPAELFANNTKITSVLRIFQNCKGLTGVIPDGLFKNCSKITEFSMAFYNTSITEIPVDIFDINNGKSNGITDLAGVFQGTQITSIPAGLFDLCTEATNLGNPWGYSGIFQDCKLIETIPDKLFYNNTKVTSFANAFNNCINLKQIPDNTFNTTESVSMANAFRNCKSITKISNEVLRGIPNVINWGSTFSGCTELIEIGDEISISNSVTNIENMFNSCIKLNIFPEKIVIPESVTNIKGTFHQCNELVTTITLKTNSAEYNNTTFYGLNSSSILNWAEPCTSEFVDEILEATAGNPKPQKGTEVTE